MDGKDDPDELISGSNVVYRHKSHKNHKTAKFVFYLLYSKPNLIQH
jgi:hypothetical protein